MYVCNLSTLSTCRPCILLYITFIRLSTLSTSPPIPYLCIFLCFCRLCQPVNQLPSNIRHTLIYLILFANNNFIICRLCRPFNLSTCQVKLSTCRPCRLVYIFYKFFLHLHYSNSEYSKTLDIAN